MSIHQTAVHYALIMLISCLVMFTNLGGARLWDRDEPRNAGCAVEMLARGDLIVPVFNDELRPHKPVLLYWLIISAYELFGINEFAARFWSAVLAMGTVLLTYLIGRRLFHGQAGLWAGIALTTSLMFVVAGRAATPDSVLIFSATAAIAVYVLSVFRASPPDVAGRPAVPQWRHDGQVFPAWPAAALMYTLMGCAVLAKGPVGLILPTAVIGMFLLIIRLPASTTPVADASAAPKGTGWLTMAAWRRMLSAMLRPFGPRHFLSTCWLMRPLTALTIAGVIALPWYLAVGWRTQGDFLAGFLLEHNVGRALRPMEGHDGSLLYYPLAILAGFFPWSVFIGPLLVGAALRIKRNDPWRLGYLFAFCWIGVYVALFSLARTKLPSYVTPCYPALALLAGCFLDEWVRGRLWASLAWMRTAAACLAAAGIVLLIALPIAANRYLPGDEWLGLLGLVPVAGALVCWYGFERDKHLLAVTSLAVTAILFSTALFGFGTVRVDRHQQFDRLLTALPPASGQPRLASFGCLEPSWVFYAGQPIAELNLNEGREPHQAVRQFLSSEQTPLLITTDEHFEQLEPHLPPGISVLEQVPYFLEDRQLVLLGRVQDEQPIRRTARSERAGQR